MKKYTFIFFTFLLGCAAKPNMPSGHISLVNKGRSIKFKGLDYAIISDINRDTTKAVWESLIPVYRMPADTAMKDYQPVQPGLYQVKDSAVVFTPDTPFAKGRTYFMRYYRFEGGLKPWDLIRGKKKPGSMPYTDFVFK